jgi:2-amino-4-hydroxy-6-hydroxymethyldihydropteridine diphosphokinase
VNTAIVGVGSNIDAPLHIARARELLAREQHFLAESAFIRTEPVGFPDQPPFLNGAFLIETEMDLEAFGGYLKELERRLGRVKGPNKYGPRSIDLDIVAWNKKVINDDFYERDFVRNAAIQLLPELSLSRRMEMRPRP